MKYIIDVPDKDKSKYTLSDKLSIPIQIGNNEFTIGIDTGLKLTPYDESAAEQRGAEKAWELAKIVCCNECDGGMDMDDIASVFTVGNPVTVFRKYSYAEASDKYEAWLKQKDEIKVGDEVVYDDGKAVVLDFVMNAWFILTDNGIVTTVKSENIKHKTGRYFDEISRIVERLNE